MTYSLWRNGRIIGHVRVPLPTSRADMVAGLLHLVDHREPLERLMQVRKDFLPGAPTFHHRLDEMKGTSGPVPLRRLSAEEVKGIPEEERFELRGDQEEGIDTPLLTLDRLDAAVSEELAASRCAEFGLPLTRWTLIARIGGTAGDGGRE